MGNTVLKIYSEYSWVDLIVNYLHSDIFKQENIWLKESGSWASEHYKIHTVKEEKFSAISKWWIVE